MRRHEGSPFPRFRRASRVRRDALPRGRIGRRLLRWGLRSLAALFLAGITLVGTLWWYLHPEVERTDDVAYGVRHGRDLTFDVLRPAAANGLGIAMMVSGGWESDPDLIEPWIVAPLLRRGYTVFAVSHLSQPEATVQEIVADVNRAIRFIRHHADDFGIDPGRLGAIGASAGGHLSLMLATRGSPGTPDARDPVDRETSAIQAAAVFFPVTDLLDLGDSTENAGDGGPPKSFVEAFGPGARDLAVWKEIGRDLSPLHHVSPALPPVLVIHGDADTLTPLDQSTRFRKAALAAGAREVELVVRRGKGHGWITIPWDLRVFGAWFDRHLAALP